MDHLPTFANASHSLRVPYVCTEKYDGLDWSTYPARHGWSKHKIHNFEFGERTPAEVAAFLQTWLFFGLLSAVLDKDIVQEDFVYRAEDGHQYVTTQDLPKILDEWRDFCDRSDIEYRQGRLDSFNKILAEASRMIARLCSIRTREANPLFQPAFWPLDGAIEASMLALGTTLTQVKHEVLAIPLDAPQYDLEWGSSELLERQMEESGWCPSVVRMLRRLGNIDILYYICHRSNPTDQPSHSACSKYSCVVEIVSNEDYTCKHTMSDCHCHMGGPLDEELISVIKNGDIALIRVFDERASISLHSQRPQLKVVAAARSAKYVAFSHVWSDGLGNPTSNSLPLCQLRRLQALANETESEDQTDPVPFWIDTLCVPVGVQHFEHRKEAIRAMRKIYKNATTVVVLDQEILNMSLNGPWLETVYTITMCKWMRRLWTLQEAILARSLIFQFSDGGLSLESLHSRMNADLLPNDVRSVPLHHTVSLRAGCDFFASLRFYTEETKDRELHVIIPTLQSRSTSQQADETTCIATLLGLDPAEILDIPPERLEDRMIKLFHLVSHVDTTLLFQVGPKLPIPGFSWAPRSFLTAFSNMELRATITDPGPAQIDPHGRGLHVTLPGFHFGEWEKPLPRTPMLLQLRNEPATCFVMTLASYDPAWSGTLRSETEAAGPTANFTPALILARHFIDEMIFFDAALVRLDSRAVDSEPPELMARWIRPMLIRREKDSKSLEWYYKNNKVVVVDLLESTQKWVVR